MRRPCREIEDWLGRSAKTLSEAQKLALERHLSGCAQCRALHEMSRAVRDLANASPAELPNSLRERAISSAFERAARPQRAARPNWLARGAGLAAVAAALVLAVRVFSPSPAQPLGWVERDGEYTFAHAQVTLAEHGRARFDEATSTLELTRGALEIDVDPRPHRAFAVRTQNFRVEVLGTQFHVDRDTVAVRHGHVRVLELEDGRVLSELRAGERYDRRVAANEPEPAAKVAPKPSTPERVATVEPKPSAPERASKAEPKSGAPSSLAEPKGVPPTKSEQPRPTASALLNDARVALGRDDLAETRRLLVEAESLTHARGDRAEAGTLRAEIALRERDLAQAIQAYLAVADAFPELPSGENALFAAAQLGVRMKRADARTLLSRYLQRYPRGRFADEARARLAAP